MSKKNKSGNEDRITKLIFITAVLQLIASIIDTISKLIE